MKKSKRDKLFYGWMYWKEDNNTIVKDEEIKFRDYFGSVGKKDYRFKNKNEDDLVMDKFLIFAWNKLL